MFSARRLVALVAAAATSLTGAGAAWADDVRGSDVSSYQHPGNTVLSWTKVKADGESFTFVKATEGVGFLSKTFSVDWKGSKAAGLMRGAYHFARPSVGSAVAQADYFVDTVGAMNAPGDLPPVLDLEANGGLTPAQLAVWTSQWLTEVRARSGRTPIIYTSPNFWQTSMGNSKAFLNYPLWVARYASAPSALVWSKWTFWQYTESGTLPGISGSVDRNKFNGTLDQLRALAGLGSASATPGGTVSGPSAPSSGVAPVSAPASAPSAAPAAVSVLPAGGRLTVKIAGTPSSVVRADGSVVTVARTGTGTIWAEYRGGKWSAVHTLSGKVASDPQVVVSAGGQLDIFARNSAGALLQRTRTAAGVWGAWRSLGNKLAGNPAVTSPSNGVIVATARGANKRLWVRRSVNGRWSGWVNTGVALTGDPSIAGNTLVARIAGGKLATATLSGAKVSRWTALAGPATGAPAASARGTRLSLVVRDSKGVLHRRVRTSGRWGGWQTLKAPANTGASVLDAANGDYAFVRSTAGDLRFARI